MNSFPKTIPNALFKKARNTAMIWSSGHGEEVAEAFYTDFSQDLRSTTGTSD